MIRITIEAKGMVELRHKLKKVCEEMVGQDIAVAIIDPTDLKGEVEETTGYVEPLEEKEEEPVQEVEEPEWPRQLDDGRIVDITMVEWDGEIHSSNKKCSKSGKWMVRRGAGPNSKKNKEAPSMPPVVEEVPVQTPPVQEIPVIQEIAEKVNEPPPSMPPVQEPSTPPAPAPPVQKLDANELIAKPMSLEVFKKNMVAIIMTISGKNEGWEPYFEKYFAERGVQGVWGIQQSEVLSEELYNVLATNGDITKEN